MRPGAKLALFVGIAVAGAVAVLFFISPIRVPPSPPKPTVASELAKIKASGAPMKMADLAGPPIPDSKNAAPVYEMAFKEVSRLSEKDIEALVPVLQSAGRGIDPAPRSKARAAIRQCRRLVSLVEQAVRRPQCRFKRDWNKGALEIMFPEFAPVRTIARVLATDAVLSAMDGNPDRALELIGLNLRVSDSIRDEPILIGALVRVAIVRISTSALREVVQRCNISEKQAVALSRQMAGMDLRRQFVSALEGERAMGIWIFDQLRRGRNVLTLPYNAKELDRDELFYLRQMASQIEMSKMPYRAVRKAGLGEYPQIPRYAAVSAILAPSYGRLCAARDRAEADLALAQTGLALEVYRRRYGRYPITLQGVRSRLSWQIPIDPFSGKDLVYRRTAKGYLLYSIGDDLSDDGGVPPPPPPSSSSKPPTSMSSKPPGEDIVWAITR